MNDGLPYCESDGAVLTIYVTDELDSILPGSSQYKMIFLINMQNPFDLIEEEV